MSRIAVVGAAGRMGRALVEAVQATPELQLGAATERAGSSHAPFSPRIRRPS